MLHASVSDNGVEDQAVMSFIFGYCEYPHGFIMSHLAAHKQCTSPFRVPLLSQLENFSFGTVDFTPGSLNPQVFGEPKGARTNESTLNYGVS